MPTWVEEQATLMKEAWNLIVKSLRDEVYAVPSRKDEIFAILDRLKETDKKGAKTLQSQLKEIRKQVWQAKSIVVEKYKQDAKVLRQMLAKYNGRMAANLKEEVIDRFKVALGEWPARRRRSIQYRQQGNGGYTPYEAGMPRLIPDDNTDFKLSFIYGRMADNQAMFHEVYDDVPNFSFWSVPHEVTGRNIEFTIRTPQGQSHLKPVKLAAKICRLPGRVDPATGVFILDHKAVIKRAYFVRKNNGFVDKYSVQAFIEYPRPPRENTGRVAGYNSLGWRHLEDRIRIGVIADNMGYYYEISVPILISGREHQREAAKAAKQGREWNKGLSYWDLIEFEQEAGTCVERCKSALMDAYIAEGQSWPKKAQQMMNKTAFDQMRDEGLRRLMALLPQCRGKEIIQQWEREMEPIRRRQLAFTNRINRIKKDIYPKLAHWITKNLDIIVWNAISDAKGKPVLKSLIESDDQPPAVKATQKYRQFVGQSHLRETVVKSAAKFGAVLLPSEKAWVCPVCGATVPRNSKLLVQCLNGHEIDQDVAASYSYLSEIPDLARTTGDPLEIPLDLRRYVRILPVNGPV